MFTKKDFEPSVSLQSSLAYWKQQLAGVSPLLSLPTNRSRRTDRAYRGSSQSFVLSRKLTTGLSSLSRQEGVTLFTTLLAAFDTLLYRYTSTEDIVVGSPVVNQNYSSIDLTFLNALVLRTDLSGNPSFQQLLERVREVILSAQNHQNVPLSVLITELQLEVDPSYSPLFQVTFTFNETVFLQDIELSSLATSPWGIEDNKAKVDLALLIEQNSNGLRGRWLYNASLFDSGTIERLNGHFQTLLASIVANPQQPISELSLLTTKEQQQLLVEFNHTQRDYPRDKCIHQLFEQQVVQNPERVAVVFEGQQLTYGELNTKANQLARYLNSLGVSSNVVVGICLERSLEMVVAFLGILKAGGAYVPLDPSYPSARLAFMLEDSQPLAILTQKRLLEVLPDRGAKVICLDTNWQEICQQKPENPVVEINSEHLAYIMYTSGSTGKPKGVMITHQGLVNHNLAIAELFELTASDRVLQSASISFDISVEEIFPTWISGASLILRNEEVLTSTRNLLEFIKREQITILDLPTALWHEIVHGMCEFGEKVPDCVRLVVVGGEKASAVAYLHWWNLVGDRCRWINTYGPTETTVSATFYEPAANLETQQFISEIPIGRPLANTQIYILDQQLQLVPIGVPGELYIGGAGVARGYFNRPELTAAKFVSNPFTHNAKTYLYKTGDLVRYLPDSNIEFLGRIDDQVKIRGFRIELGEIEALLAKHPDIRETALIVREDLPGDKRLVACIVPDRDRIPTINDLRDFLSQNLPKYSIPSAFVTLAALPLTPNGKVDRRALLARTVPNTFISSDAIAQTATSQADKSALAKVNALKMTLDTSANAPRTRTEEILAGFWCQVLGLDTVSIHDNFFMLGGHSLLAARMIGYCYQTFSKQLSLREVFESPTIAGLAEIIDRSQKQETKLSNYQIITQRANRHSAPLSFPQQRLWFLEQLEPNRADYHIELAVRITGSLNVAALQQALNAIVTRHEALRTNFISKDGKPIQVIREPQTVELVLVNLQNCSAMERDTKVHQRLQQERQRSFNLSQDLMLRSCLLQVTLQEYILQLVIHHIAFDGWSLAIFCQELNSLYTVFCNGFAPSLPELPIQYADFAEWQRQQLFGQKLENQLKYWKQQIAGADLILELPTDYSRPLTQTFSGASQSLVLNQSLTASLKVLACQQESTLFMVLMATFQILLSRHSGQENFLVGSPFAGRNRTELEGLIGFFVTTLVLRADLSGNPSFRELLSRVREMILSANSYQDLPFEKIVEELHIKRDLSRNPLFQVWFNMLNFEESKIELQGLRVEPLVQKQVNSKFDLTLYLQEKYQTIELELVYNTNLFTPERMAEMLKQFEYLLSQIIANPAARIHELSLITPSAAAILPNPQQPIPYTWIGAVHNQFSQQAQRVPQQLAVVDALVSWNYAELEERTNLLANYLLDRQIKSQDIVAIYAHRNVALVWAILGVLKAGAAFVILDPAYPASRLINYLEISQPRAFLHTSAKELPKSILETLKTLSCDCCLTLTSDSIEVVRCQFYGYENHNPRVEIEPDDLAYIAFTSGSTGKPKGILGTHRPLSHFLQWHSQTFGFNQSDRFSLLSGLSHDPLLRDIFTPLTLGATLCIPRQQEIAILGRLAEWMVQQKVTVSHLTPSMLQVLAVNTTVPNTYQRYVFFGGDTLTVQDLEKIRIFAPNATYVNFYGATETPQAMGYFINPKLEEGINSKETIPIGKGITDVQLLVLNQQKQLAGIGELGEIYVRTPYLAKGYIANEKLTRERFIINPFTNISEDRLYKTGDLGSYLPNGDIEFLGRSDRQAKIRGFRIELAEIEVLLSQHPRVQQNVVTVREDEPGNKCLAAYIVTHSEQELNTRELCEFLKKQLPDYMVPSAFTSVKAIPLTPNGKIDRHALPTPIYGKRESKKTFVTPRNQLESQITKIWERVLGIQPIGVKDNFFELGGNSLTAVRLFAEIENIWSRSLPLAALFEVPTVEKLASLLRQEESSVAWSSLVPIQPNGSKLPLFCIHPIGGNVLEYHSLANYLDREQPIYGLQAQGLDGKQEPLRRVEDMANHYINEICSFQPNGPYLLAGYSFGGLVAFDMARKLHDRGEKVALLVLLDTSSPNLVKSNSSLVKFIRVHLSNLWQLKPKDKLRYIKNWVRWKLNKGNYKDFISSQLFETLKNGKVIDCNFQAAQEYIPQVYPKQGKVTLFRSKIQPVKCADNLELGWKKIVDINLEIEHIPGDHYSVLKEPTIQLVAEKLKFYLERAQTKDL